MLNQKIKYFFCQFLVSDEKLINFFDFIVMAYFLKKEKKIWFFLEKSYYYRLLLTK